MLITVSLSFNNDCCRHMTLLRGVVLNTVSLSFNNDYCRHMTLLKKDYGLVMILNLLSNKPDTDESHLSNQFQVSS